MIFTSHRAFLEAAAARKGSVVGSSLLDLHFPDGNGAFEIEASDLVRLLEDKNSRLEVIKMRYVSLAGDIRPLLRSLGRQTNLQSFQAEFCCFDSSRVALVLAALPALETLNIVGHKGLRWQRQIPVTALIRLAKSGQLRDLRLDRIGNFNQQHAGNFFREMLRSNVIQVLWCLSSNFTSLEVELVARMLEDNESLTDLRFSVVADTSTKPIAKALASNQTLTNLGVRLVGETDLAPEDLECFATALKGNYVLKDLMVARGTIWSNDKRKHVPICDDEMIGDIYKKIDFYLALNQRGRGFLLRDTHQIATGEDWLSPIASQWDLSIVYYFARANPFLVLPRELGGIVPSPSRDTRTDDEAGMAKKCSSLFPTVRLGSLNLMGSNQVQDALVCLRGSIQKLSICFGSNQGSISSTDLATLVDRTCHTLETILLDGVEITGPFEPFLKAVLNTKNLMHLSLQGCKGFDAGELENVLSALPILESLTCSGNQETTLSFAGLNKILQQRPMKFMALDGVQCKFDSSDESDLALFFDLVEHSTTLKFLRCETHAQGFATSHLRRLGSVLLANTSLKNLQIKVSPDASLAPLAKGLCGNRVLTGLCVTSFRQKLADPEVTAFESMLLSSNSTLRSFIVGGCDLNGLLYAQSIPIQQERDSLERIRALLNDNIARSRPYPLAIECFNAGVC